MPSASGKAPQTSCVVVAICGSDALRRCADNLRRLDPPPDEIIVAAADGFAMPPNVADAADIQVVHCGSNSPVALAAAGIAASTGRTVCLLEDHCLPDVGWLGALSTELVNNEAQAAGGPIDTAPDTRGFDWAFFMVDFFRYLPPVSAGPVSMLSVCNVAYRRTTLDAIREEWEHGFHETHVHGLLESRGTLLMAPEARVVSNRRVASRDGIRERYTFGRLFAAKRFRRSDLLRRIVYSAGTPLLPLVIYARIAQRCARDRVLSGRLISATPQIAALLAAWALGELAGYVTGRPPAASPAAADRPADRPLASLSA